MTSELRRSASLSAAAVLAGSALCLLALGTASAASAATLSDVISDQETTTVTSPNDEVITTRALWAIPESAEPGDTFTLSETLQAGGELSSQPVLVATDGSVVATGISDSAGNILFTITPVGASLPDVHGTLELQTVVTTTSTPTPPTLLDDLVLGTVFVGQGLPTTLDPTTSHKFGTLIDADTNLNWVIDTAPGPWESLVVSDRLDPGQPADCGTLSVESTTTVDPTTGALINLQAVDPARYALSCTTANIELTVGTVNDGEILRVNFIAAAETPNAPESGAGSGSGPITGYANQANVSAERSNPPVETQERTSTFQGVAVTPPPTPTPTPTPTPPPAVTIPPSPVPVAVVVKSISTLPETGPELGGGWFAGALIISGAGAMAWAHSRRRVGSVTK